MAKTIEKGYVTKIEGHAKLTVKIEDNKIKKAKLDIFEGTRFFEGIVKGHSYNDISPVTSRICGICSVAHGLAALRAVENAFGVKVTKQTKTLRKLMHMGGIIQSHTLHLYFMVLPSHFGYDSALHMAGKHKAVLEQGLLLKRAANSIVKVIGGRDVHPFTFVVGGFSSFPEKKELFDLLITVRAAKKAALDAMELFANLKYPIFEKEREYFALEGAPYFFGDKAILCEGKVCAPVSDYENYFKEYFKAGSTSEFARTSTGKKHMVGALARIINNGAVLSKTSKPYVKKVMENRFSPYTNNLAQAIEIYEGFSRAEEILKNLKIKDEKPVKAKPRKAVGFGAVEAPRGTLFHKYTFDSKGCVTKVNITTPTSQNLENLEENIKTLLPSLLDKSQDEIVAAIEELIRAYDPCISCSTHFLDIIWE